MHIETFDYNPQFFQVNDDGKAGFATEYQGVELNLGVCLEESSKIDLETAASASSEIPSYDWKAQNSYYIPMAVSEIFQVPEHMKVITPPTEPVNYCLPQKQQFYQNSDIQSAPKSTTNYAKMMIIDSENDEAPSAPPVNNTRGRRRGMSLGAATTVQEPGKKYSV